MCVTGRRVQGGEARRENLLELTHLWNNSVNPYRFASHVSFHSSCATSTMARFFLLLPFQTPELTRAAYLLSCRILVFLPRKHMTREHTLGSFLPS